MNRKGLSWNQKLYMLILPGFIGVAFFNLIPFIRILYYSVIKSQFRHELVWLDNYKETWKNRYFQMAFRNSILMIVRDIPVLIIIAIVLAILLTFVIRKDTWVGAAFILPMVIPTAGIVVIWKKIFESVEGTLPIDVLFVWKNVGICIILLTAAFSSIPDEVYDAAKIDGANILTTHIYMTIPMASESILFTILLSIMNSYKIFKESYLYYGTSYPPDYAYTLQYYMNNHFLKLNYQSLASASVYSTLVSIMFIVIAFRLIKRFRA